MCKRRSSFYILSTVTYFSLYFWFKKKIKLVPVFRRSISNGICDLVLYLLYEGLNILIYEGTIPVRYLKAVVATEDSALSETGSQFISRKWIVPIWEREDRSKNRLIHLSCAAWSLSFRILLSRGNHDAQLSPKWG